MKVSLIIFFSIGISCFFITVIFLSNEDSFITYLISFHGKHNLLTMVTEVLEILQQVNAENGANNDNNMNRDNAREGYAETSL